MNNPVVGDVVMFDGKFTKVIDRLTISQIVHYALKGQGVKFAVPSQSIEWNGQHFIVNPYKLNGITS